MKNTRTKLIVAQNVDDIADAFDAMALSTQEDMDRFYVETMKARTGKKYKSPIVALEKACRRPTERAAMLLMGHRGCGKSTELNRMKLRLEGEGRNVIIIECDERLQLVNRPCFSDLLILMGEALFNLAKKLHVHVSDDTLKKIQSFWTPVMRTTESVKAETVEIGAGLETKTPSLLDIIGKLFLKLTSDIKYNDEVRKKSEERININYADWQAILYKLSDDISDKARTQPVLIFEGLDHLEDLEEARHLFFEHAGKLTDVSFPVIYTFPIALSYDEGFGNIEHLFQQIAVFPMLKLEYVNGEPYADGKALLETIVNRRAREGLIDTDALGKMIDKTGGSFRDLFRAIREAAEIASYRGEETGNPNETITMEDAEQALQEIKNALTRRIEGDQHRFLAEICLGNRLEITKRDKLLKMLQARTVLEYNGKCWHNVHPLVADYLEELGYIRRAGKKWEAGERYNAGQQS